MKRYQVDSSAEDTATVFFSGQALAEGGGRSYFPLRDGEPGRLRATAVSGNEQAMLTSDGERLVLCVCDDARGRPR